MGEATDRLGLPLLAAGQAQKEVTHNEALIAIDALLHGAVETHGLDTPPGSPAIGQCWIVGSSPDGDWTGKAGAVAAWTSGGWRFVVPHAGMTLWDRTNGYFMRHDGSAWTAGDLRGNSLKIWGVQVVGPRLSAIAGPSGGAVVDNVARDTIDAILNALRVHGLIAE